MRQLWTQAAVIALTAGTLGAYGEAASAAGQRLTPNFPITQTPAQPTATTAATARARNTLALMVMEPPVGWSSVNDGLRVVLAC